MESYSFLAIKLTIGIIGLILQINLMGIYLSAYFMDIISLYPKIY